MATKAICTWPCCKPRGALEWDSPCDECPGDEHPSTTAEVRKFYEDQGCKVRIDKEGHVAFKAQPGGPWLEGRWVSEYRTCKDGHVRLT